MRYGTKAERRAVERLFDAEFCRCAARTAEVYGDLRHTWPGMRSRVVSTLIRVYGPDIFQASKRINLATAILMLCFAAAVTEPPR